MQKYREMANRSGQAALARLSKGKKPSAGMTAHGRAMVKAAPETSHEIDKGIAPTAGKAPKNRMDKLARGGAVKLAKGGRAATKINIMIAGQGQQPPQRVPVPVPVPGGPPPMQARPPMAPPPMGGPGMPPGAMPPAPGGMPPGGPPMGMVRKTGGRAHLKRGGHVEAEREEEEDRPHRKNGGSLKQTPDVRQMNSDMMNKIETPTKSRDRVDGATPGETMDEVRDKQSKRGDQVLGHRKHGGKVHKDEAEDRKLFGKMMKEKHEKHEDHKRARGGRTPHMTAGAMSGEGRIEKTEHAAREHHKAPAV